MVNNTCHPRAITSHMYDITFIIDENQPAEILEGEKSKTHDRVIKRR